MGNISDLIPNIQNIIKERDKLNFNIKKALSNLTRCRAIIVKEYSQFSSYGKKVNLENLSKAIDDSVKSSRTIAVLNNSIFELDNILISTLEAFLSDFVVRFDINTEGGECQHLFFVPFKSNDVNYSFKEITPNDLMTLMLMKKTFDISNINVKLISKEKYYNKED